MFDNFSEFVKVFDSNLTLILKKLYQPYVPYTNPPFLSKFLPNFTKVIIYSLFVLLPFLLLKVLFPYKKPLTIVIYILLLVMGFSVFGIVIGFFQIAYSF